MCRCVQAEAAYHGAECMLRELVEESPEEGGTA